LENSDGRASIDLDPAGSPDDDSEDFLEDIAEGITVTIEGAAQGTPASSPPEMALGKPTDWRSDVFSTGVLLYLLLTGEYPFYAPTKAGVREKVVNEEPVPVSVARRSGGPVPLRLIAIVIKALRKKPEERFQTISDMHDALLSVLHEIEGGPEAKPAAGVEESVNTGPKSYAAHRARKFPPKATRALSIIAGVMLVIYLVWYVFTGTASP
jgi:serine/threonine protein kinase